MNQTALKSGWEEEYNNKLCSADEAAKAVKSNNKVALSGGTCIPPAFCRALSANGTRA
jgi:acyl-CoA hydrolase